MPFDGPLKPGDAVGVSLLTGDVEGATGTRTHIDGDSKGCMPSATRWRTTSARHRTHDAGVYVYTVPPSLASSFKLSTTGEAIGTFLQDSGDCAIAGGWVRVCGTIRLLTLESPR